MPVRLDCSFVVGNHSPIKNFLPGVFGYVAVDGTADFAVVIRTLVIKGDSESAKQFTWRLEHC